MHWFDGRLRELGGLANRFLQYRQLAASNVAGSAEAARQARETFVSDLCNLVSDVAERPGVEACFATHEGLLVASAGDSEDFDALAAMSQTCLATATKSPKSLSIGPMKQMVIVGEHRKLALFTIGDMALGVLGLSTTVLSEALR